MGAEFMRQNDVKMAPPRPPAAPPKIIPSDVNPAFAYGRRCRPSTPIAAVVGGDYEAAHREHLDNLYRMSEGSTPAGDRKHRIKMNKSASARITEVRSLKLAQSDPEAQKKYFKLRKFEKVPSKLETAALRKSASTPALLRTAEGVS